MDGWIERKIEEEERGDEPRRVHIQPEINN